MTNGSHLLGIAFLVASLGHKSTAAGQPSDDPQPPPATEDPGSPPPPPPRAKGLAPEADNYRLEWDYPEFRWWEYAMSGVFTALSFSVEFTGPNLRITTWSSVPGFDREIDEALGAKTARGLDVAKAVSDGTWYGTQAFAIADSFLIPLITDNLNWKTSVQMTLINWQVMGLAGLSTRSFHKTIPRDRPLGTGSSFNSGHTTLATASAGLICNHHANLPLYGGGVADAVPCVLGVGAAAATGVLRLRARKHYTTDVLSGWAFGALLGGGLPWLLHYRYDKPESNLMLSDWHTLGPFASESEIGLRARGLF